MKYRPINFLMDYEYPNPQSMISKADILDIDILPRWSYENVPAFSSGGVHSVDSEPKHTK